MVQIVNRLTNYFSREVASLCSKASFYLWKTFLLFKIMWCFLSFVVKHWGLIPLGSVLIWTFNRTTKKQVRNDATLKRPDFAHTWVGWAIKKKSFLFVFNLAHGVWVCFNVISICLLALASPKARKGPTEQLTYITSVHTS